MKTQDGITFTLCHIKYYYSAGVFGVGKANYYYNEEDDQKTIISWTNPSDPAKSIVVTSIYFYGRNESNKTTTISTTYSNAAGVTPIPLFNNNTWTGITFNTTTNSDIMSTYGLVNGQEIIITNQGKTQFQNITITYDIRDAPFPLFQHNASDDYTAAETAFIDQFNATQAYVNEISNPQWIRDYAARLLRDNNTANLSDYTTKNDSLNSYTQYTSISSLPVNMTGILSNANFQSPRWNDGWIGTYHNYYEDQYKRQYFVKQTGDGDGNDKNNFTSGTIFAEMWAGKNNTLSAGDLYQTVRLPQGVYKLSADVRNRRITSYLYASISGSDLATCACDVDAVTNSSIMFAVSSSESDVQIGYRHAQTTSSEGDVWTAVDNFTLKNVEKLNLTVSSNLGSDAIFVDDVKTSAFTFTYDDTDFTPPSPSSSSSSSDFYYTITTNTISSITDGSNDVITYDPATNKITAVNAGTATITFHQNETSTLAEKEYSFTVTVSKIANPITVTLDGVNRNSKNISFSTDVSFSYSALNGGAVTITKREGGAGASTLNNEKTIFTSSAATEGVDYWDLSIAENYKYEGSSAFVRIQVNATPEEESYLYTYLIDGSDYEIQDNNSIEIKLDYSPLEIRYQAKRNNFFSIVKCACTSYYANGDEIKRETDDLDTGFGSKTHVLPEDTRKIVLSRSGTTGTPIVKDIYVVRRTYVNATVDKANLGEVLVSNTETATITVNWGTSNGGNITVESDNTHFTVSSSSIAVTDNSNGTANITVTYTPVAGTLGTEQAIITLHDRYHTATVNLQATAINNKTLVNGYGFMYNSSHKIKIDDEGTKVYEARYTSETHTVTLQELVPVSSNLIIPAGKVVLLYKAADIAKESSTIHYEYSTADNAHVLPVSEDNCFKRVSYSADVVNYVLAKKNGEVAFYRYTGEETNLNVLQLPNESGLQAPSMIRIVTEDNTATALVPVYEENSAAAGQKANSKKIFIDGHLYIQQGNNLYDALGRKVQ